MKARTGGGERTTPPASTAGPGAGKYKCEKNNDNNNDNDNDNNNDNNNDNDDNNNKMCLAVSTRKVKLRGFGHLLTDDADMLLNIQG